MAETDATPVAPETAPGELKNDATTVGAPATDNTNQAEVERLRKEAEQAKMRANQLENQLKAKEQAEETARQKNLEENQQYKELADARATELDTLKKEREAESQRTEREAAQKQILADYPQSVVELAETTGLNLADITDEAKAALKSKLDAVAEKLNVTPGKKVTASNPATQIAAEEPREKLLEGMKVGFKPAAGQFISTLPAIKEMKRSAGIKVD